jgi:glycosyltransferase involved in cell wall biosynthesis
MTQQHSYVLHEVGGRNSSVRPQQERQLLAVIWIDWYAYHVARLRALAVHPALRQRVTGLELVGGAGVHGKLVFRSAEREGLPITTLLPQEGWSQAGQRRLARLVWDKLNELKPAAVLVPGYYTLPALAAMLWARLHGKRAILMSESTRGDHPRKRWLEVAKGAFLTRAFQAAITGGKRQAAYLKDLGFREEHLAGLYDVVGNEYFAEQADYCRERTSREEWSLPERYFVYVGRLAPEKNLTALLAAFAAYRERGGGLSLVLVGDGPEGNELRRQAAALRISDQVVFAGLKDTREIGPYYAFAEWFILPSWLDPWGLVVNEAMAAGLPVLVSDRCGCSDDLVENGRNGFTFNPAEDGSLLQALVRTSDVSEARRQRMARRSRDIISRYSPRLWAEEVVRIAGFSNHPKR